MFTPRTSKSDRDSQLRTCPRENLSLAEVVSSASASSADS